MLVVWCSGPVAQEHMRSFAAALRPGVMAENPPSRQGDLVPNVPVTCTVSISPVLDRPEAEALYLSRL